MNGHEPDSSATGAAAAEDSFGARILALADRLAQSSEAPDRLSCTYLTPAHRAVASQLREWMQAAGMSAEIDVLGNVVGRYASSDPAAKTLVAGSHYDTVLDAGKYDGRLGILVPLVVVEHLDRIKQRLPFDLELIGFAEEEGVRFGTPYIGSRAVTGRFDAALLDRRDAAGLSMGDVIRAAGGDPQRISALARRPQDLRGYLEVHIEQGPVLLQAGLPVGVVTAIAGCARFLIAVTGTAGHAGTVPMAVRRDAAAAAAEIVLCVEQRCAQAPTLVGTVGRLVVADGAINVIPGRCDLSLDIRAGDDVTRDAAAADVLAEIGAIGKRRGVTIETREIQRTPAVPCSPRFRQQLADAIARKGIRPHDLPSGAGHDASMFNGLTEIGMLFVRCGNGGISHSPLETVTAEDADIAARIFLDVLTSLR